LEGSPNEMTKKDEFPKVKTNAMKMFVFSSKFDQNKLYDKKIKKIF
jgi:hypothetical protein